MGTQLNELRNAAKNFLEDGGRVFIGRHMNTRPAKNDADRVGTEIGFIETKRVKKLLIKESFHPRIIISSPAFRVDQTRRELFGHDGYVNIIYDSLYHFEQFPGAEKLYKNKVTDPMEYRKIASPQVDDFLIRLGEIVTRWDPGDVAIMAHAIITNFIAELYSDDKVIYKSILKESAGFLITKDGVRILEP